MEYLLVLYIYAGLLAKGDSVAITTITFGSETECRNAGEAAAPLVKGSSKEIRYICLPRKRV